MRSRNESGLTPRQQATLEAFEAYVREQLRPPSMRELAARMGISSTNGIVIHIDALVAAGFLVRGEVNQPRSLRLVGRDCTHCGGSGLEPRKGGKESPGSG